ncbi:DUF1028 domain-containing protein [Mycolicibacterium sp. CH28]|uniref:DUF1028 domain-containing protein n=1 Tax=Mycolicibacterium sp. CH28 TaxID=2512237 RepID=UPI001080089C|nr:DUF1028 domain-containing protein [Mycolicibacterium sp. CH28]TGD87509.1 DUF1028 domain-containing protein [Mycolicibacterium sp. CH28]
MTFSIVARDATTGRIGLAAATSDFAVGARVIWGRARCGGVLTQHSTDPRLGPRGLDLLASGCDAEQTIAALVASADCAPARQLAVVDAQGGATAWAGAYVDPARAYQQAFDGFAVLGNILTEPSVGDAIAHGYRDHPQIDFAARLLVALRAGLEAGGEQFPLVSAALKVYDIEDFAYVDLRVDSSRDPLADLIELNVEFTPLRDGYVTRALDPDVGYAAEYAPEAAE